MAQDRAMLEVEGIEACYGTLRALQGVSLSIAHGSTTALLGANGAGKSSLARVIGGLVKPTAGRVVLDGTDITGWPAHRIRRAGVVYLPEERGISRGLTVIDNLRFAATALESSKRRSAVDRALTLFPVLADRRNQVARTLSGGEQQILALGRALMDDPRLLVVDELSLGLAPKVVNVVFAGLANARVAGISILLIEQFVNRALDFADSCVVLRRGSVAWAGTTAQTLESGVTEQYFGAAVTA